MNKNSVLIAFLVGCIFQAKVVSMQREVYKTKSVKEQSEEEMFKINLLEGNHEAVIAALKNGVNPNSRIEEYGGSYTPLDVALDANNVEIFNELLKAGANPNSYNSFKEKTILERAVDANNATMVGLLLEKGAEPNPITSSGKRLIENIEESKMFSRKRYESLRPIIEFLQKYIK